MAFCTIFVFNKEINIFLLRTGLIKIDVKQVLITNFVEKGDVYNRKSTSFFYYCGEIYGIKMTFK